MTLVKYKRPISRRNSTFPSMFDEFIREAAGGKECATHVPSVNIKEEDDKFVLEMSAAGYTKENVALKVEDDVLTITGEHKEKKEENGEKSVKFITREFSKGNFKRAFNLNSMVDADKIDAKFDSGILTVTMPKVESAVSKLREINIG